MSSETRSEDNQKRILRPMIADSLASLARFGKEREIIAEAFTHTCGHNRLEQIGVRWSAVLSPSSTHILATDQDAAAGFAVCLHAALMSNLLPSDAEIEALPKTTLSEWTVALRMGFQGVLRRRAFLCGESIGRTAFPQPNEEFLLSMQPTILHAADEFFLNRPEVLANSPGVLAGSR